MTEIRYPFVLVTGRADGDDEDGYSTYQNMTESEAMEAFREGLAELNDTTAEDDGFITYINLVVGSTRGFTVLYAN